MPRIPPKGRPIQPGERRNPKGSSAKARAMAQVKRMTADQLAELTSLLLLGNRNAIQVVANNPDASFIQVLTAKLLVDCYKKGDISIYNGVLDRVVGKPKQTKELSGPDGGPIAVARSTETIEEKKARVEAMRKARLEVEGK